MIEFKRGSFYLGATAPPAKDPKATPVMYDARDLTTHGVIVGMTGSGKTGLAVDLIEEALLSGIPVLVLDPKGDMGNLLLNFPDLRPEPGQLRIRQHTDRGGLTLLWADQAPGGLEVMLPRSREWVPVLIPADAFLVQAGDPGFSEPRRAGPIEPAR